MLSNIQLDKANVNNAKWIIQNGDSRFARKTKKLTYHMWQISYLNDVLEARLELARTFLPKGF